MNMQPVPAPPKSRLAFIDLLRGWALLVMIEVHVFNAFLLPELRLTQWYNALNFINGLVAPSFTFISGFVFLLASQKKLESFRMYGPAFWKQIGRIGLIWITGYILHLPFYSFRRSISESTTDQLLSFYQSDVLHCIAFGLLVLFLLRLVIKSDRIYKNVLLSSGLFVVITALFIWDYDFTLWIPAPLAAYLNSRHYSLFPLFPWLAFMLFGGYSAAGYITARENQKEKSFILRLASIGAILILIYVVKRALFPGLPFGSLDIRANPFFFFGRLGIVMLLMTICWFYALYRKTERSFVLNVGKESLMVYAAHLMIIYGQFWNDKSFAYYFYQKFGTMECIAGTIIMLLVMIGAAILWGWLKRDHLPLARFIFWIFAGTLTIMFFIS